MDSQVKFEGKAIAIVPRFGAMVLVGLGLLLIVAAVLKGYEHLSLDADAPDYGWPIAIALVCGQAGLGVLICLTVRHRPTVGWALALITFAGFSGYSVRLLIDGAPTCGCFGSLHVHPRNTLVLDLLAVITLGFFPPWASREQVAFGRKRIATYIVSSSLTIAVVLAFSALGLTSEWRESAQAVILDAATWEGKRFPLIDNIDIGDRLQTGDWLVILYRKGCGRCARSLQPFAKELAGERPFSVAIVEVPPCGKANLKLTGPSWFEATGRLDTSRPWKVREPVLVAIRNGVVQPNADGHFASRVLGIARK